MARWYDAHYVDCDVVHRRPHRPETGRREGGAMGQSTKSLRDSSPLRGAGELIKLNPLGTEQGYIGTVIDLDEESNAT